MEVPAAPPPIAGSLVPSRRVVVLVAGTALLLGALWLGRDILAPFAVGLLVIYLLDPVVERLARVEIAGRRAPRGLLILLVYVVTAVAIVELLLLLVGPLVEQVRALVEAAPGYFDMLEKRVGEVFAWWNRLDLPEDVRDAIGAALSDLLASIGSLVPEIIRPIFSSVVGLVGSVFGYLIIPVWAFWILKDRPAIVRGFDRAVPREWQADSRAIVGIIRRVFGSWIRGQVVLGLVVGSATFVGLLVLGAIVDPVFGDYAVLLAVIAGILELLPIIGPIIAAVPAILLGATAGLPGIIAAFLLYLAVQQVENTVLVPKIQGDATKLHPAVVIFALILGGAIAGLLGAILALPVAATARDLYLYAFRRASGLTPVEAATGDARPSAGTELGGPTAPPPEIPPAAAPAGAGVGPAEAPTQLPPVDASPATSPAPADPQAPPD